MAISVKELGRKAEDLIEKGRDADKQVQMCQSRVAQASSQVAEARRQIELASELDEEGKPKGNIDAAYASLRVAENHLEASRRAYSEAQERVERIKGEKQSHAEKLSEYSAVEKNNLDKLKALRNRAFSNNASALSEGIASRLNEAEQARAELLRSMGIEATTITESGEIGGSGGSPWGRQGFSSIDFSGGRGASGGRGGAGEGTSSGTAAAPVGGGLASPTGTGYSGRETGNYESAPEKRDRVDIEHGPEIAPSFNPYGDQWEEFAREFRGGEPSSDWDSLSEVPFAGESRVNSFANNMHDAFTGGQNGITTSGNGNQTAAGEKKSMLSFIRRETIRPVKDIKPLSTTRQQTFLAKNHEGHTVQVFDHPQALYNKVAYEQGRNTLGKTGTCSLANVAVWLSIAGSKNKEDDVVKYASSKKDLFGNTLCDTDGGVFPSDIPKVWRAFGIPARNDKSRNLEHIAAELEQGKAVSLGVNAGKLWERDNPEGFILNDPFNDCYGSGGANHQIGLVSFERDPVSGEITHFYINDTGRCLQRDACRRIPAADLEYAFASVPGASATISKKPVW